MVRTLVGQGLFEFGDQEGDGEKARLQHDLGVCFAPSDGMLYVADSYNNRIKRLNPITTYTVEWAGSGVAELQDGVGTMAAFWEPGGLSVAGGKLYVADTNNHAIRVVNLGTRVVSTLEIKELEAPDRGPELPPI